MTAKTAVQPLNRRQKQAIIVFALGAAFEFFDNYVIAFVLAFIVKPWGLTAGQSAIVLLSSGVGGLLGSLIWGWLADRVGRKRTFAYSLFLTAGASLALALTPEGNWLYLAAVRAVVGLGVGGFFVPIILAQEMVPARKGYVSGLLSTAAASGLVMGAVSAATLSAAVGWRGLFLVGAVPALIGVATLRLLPESPGWLRSRGRVQEADAAQAWIGSDAFASGSAEYFAEPERVTTRTLLAGMSANVCTVTAYTALVMWAPTLISQVQGIPPRSAATLMIVISALGMISRLTIGAVSDRTGRRAAGIAVTLGGAASVMLAASVARGALLPDSYFWWSLAVCFIFADASFAVLAAYTAEIFPAGKRGRSAGLSYAAGGVGKVLGPLGFALAIGASNIIRPEVTLNSIGMGFGFVAILFLGAAATYAFLHPQPR